MSLDNLNVALLVFYSIRITIVLSKFTKWMKHKKILTAVNIFTLICIENGSVLILYYKIHECQCRSWSFSTEMTSFVRGYRGMHS